VNSPPSGLLERKRVEAKRELAVKRVGYAPEKASILHECAQKTLRESEWYRETCFRLWKGDENRYFFIVRISARMPQSSAACLKFKKGEQS